MGGIRDNNVAIWMSCAVTGVNFVCTVIPIILVERIGRRKLLLGSMVGVIVSLAILGVGFLLIHNTSATVAYKFNGTQFITEADAIKKCGAFDNCDSCVTVETCGFCYNKDDPNNSTTYGACLPNEEGKSDLSLVGECKNLTNSNYVWANNWCESTVSWIPIVGMLLYLCSFSVGFAPIPWVLNSEFYPSWARSTGAALATFFNWVFNLIISQTFLQLTESITKYGAFFLYMGITCFSTVLFFFIVPETKGLQIEEIELLFMTTAQRERTISMKRGMELLENSARKKSSAGEDNKRY